MAKDCKPPESIPGMPQEALDVLNNRIEVEAERRIFKQYCRREGFNEFTSVFPNRNFDGTQLFVDEDGLRTMTLIAFLKLNNPHVNEQALATQAVMAGGGVKNPDFWAHSPARPSFDFYEIKPNSKASIPKGIAKVANLEIMCAQNKLSYVAGVNYTPIEEEEILWIENKGIFVTTITLRWSRIAPGLIVYDVCRETKARVPVPEKVVSAAADALMKAAMIAMLIALGIADAVFG